MVVELAGRPELLVAGRWVPAVDTYSVPNPATGEAFGVAAAARPADSLRAAAAAAEVTRDWAQTPLPTRTEVLRVAAERLQADRDALVELVVSETGATRTVAESTQVDAAIRRLRRYADVGELDLQRWLPTQSEDEHLRFEARRRPVGVTACISPYNFPLLAMVGKVAPALVAGNPVVMKPAPQAPLAVVALAHALHGALRDVGVPVEAVGMLTGPSADVGRTLTTSPNVRAVSFTGSTAVGREIHRAAATSMKRLLLELGGKGACIVLDDADLDVAAALISRTWRVHAGQVCLAPSRVIASHRIVGELTSRLTAILEDLVVGDPARPETHVGPLISAEHRDRVQGFISGAATDGATPVSPGAEDSLPARGWYAPPTLLLGCRPDMRVAQEEVFGPVVSVLQVDGDDEAVAVANGTDYGLQDYVVSRDPSHAHRIADRLDAGMIEINTHQRHPEAPFGGNKMSGVGRAGGLAAVHAYTDVVTVTEPG